MARRPCPSRADRLVAATAAGLAAIAALVSTGAGRMAPLTALCFVVVAGGLLGLDRPRLLATGQWLAVAAGFITFLSVTARAYGAAAVKPMDASWPPPRRSTGG